MRRLLAESLATFDVFDRSFPSCVMCGDVVLRESQMSLRDFVSEHTSARFHDTVCRTCPPTYDPEPSVSIEAFLEANP